ncbi:hypothetical protein ACEQ8H_005682 [Pleosporales sp. CAS-2024a]
MRSVSEAEKHWRQLADFHSLTDLRIHVSAHKEPLITAGLRSVCWKIFLVFRTLHRSSWPAHLANSRNSYASLRDHYLRAIRHPDEFESSVDPLSEHDHPSKSPWVALRADEALRAEIFQDIERCMPDNVYFRQPGTQDMMLDILFVWSKMHPTIGYRQGMHEILAPLLWVVERDAVKEPSPADCRSYPLLVDVLDSRYIEHDAHTLFSLIMQTAKSFYAPVEPGSAADDTPMLIRSSRIFDKYLPKADPELFAHLVKLELVPQIFLLRWIRLLFGREFALDAVLDMWDALFAIDSTLELVDMISVAMLLRIRWRLVAADTNEAFSLLLRYPEPADPAYTFIKDALYLRDHLHPQGGAEIISRYGKQAPTIEPEAPTVLPQSSPSPSTIASYQTRRGLASPRGFVGQQQGAGLEAILQGAAKNVLERGSQWGVGKAIREAVGEVKKNVEAYQSAASSGQSTPRAGGREFRKPAAHVSGASNGSKPSLDRTNSANALRKIERLEKRNGNLAKMLETVVGDLWEHHKQRAEEHISKNDNNVKAREALEALSIAIAKVQFVQVYLEDSSIPLPEETTDSTASETAVETLTLPAPTSPLPERVMDASASIEPCSKPAPREPVSEPAASPKAISASRSTTSPPVLPKTAQPRPETYLSPRARPHLTSSNFSWMLGDESPSSNFATGTAHSTFSSDEKRRMKGKGFLFGDDDEDDGSVKEGKRGSMSSSKSGKNTKGKHVPELQVEEEIIDLDNMGKRGVL